MEMRVIHDDIYCGLGRPKEMVFQTHSFPSVQNDDIEPLTSERKVQSLARTL